MKIFITNTIVLLIFFFCLSLISAVVEQYKKITVAEIQENYSSQLPKPETIDELIEQTNQLPPELLKKVASEYERLEIVVLVFQILMFPLFGWLFKWLNTPKIVASHQ
jgi:uncharacterized membrane protein